MSEWNTSAGWSNGASGAFSGAATGMSVGGPIGALIGGVGGLVSGLFGTKKSTNWNRKYFNESVRQFNVQDEYNKNRLQYTIKDAIKAGVNPVAAINSGAGHYSPTISAGGGSGSESGSGFDTQGFINGINNFISAKQSRQDRAIALESANLDLESKRLENQILRQRLLTESQPGIVSTNGNAPKNNAWRIPMDYRLRDVGDLYLPWRDRHGNIHWFINPDAISDADWSNIEAVRALTVGAGELSRDYVPRDGSYAKKNWPKFRRYVRSLVGVN